MCVIVGEEKEANVAWHKVEAGLWNGNKFWEMVRKHFADKQKGSSLGMRWYRFPTHNCGWGKGGKYGVRRGHSSRFRTRNSGVWVPVRSALSVWDPHNWATSGKPWKFMEVLHIAFAGWKKKSFVAKVWFGIWDTVNYISAFCKSCGWHQPGDPRKTPLWKISSVFFLCRTNPSQNEKKRNFFFTESRRGNSKAKQ